MEHFDFAVVMKALSDPTRLKIIQLLAKYDFCVGALARKVNASEASVSQHLKVLRKAGLVSGEKRGYYTHYDVNTLLFEQLIAALKGIITKETQRKQCLLNENISHADCVHSQKRRRKLK